MKTRQLGGKEIQKIQNTGIKDSYITDKYWKFGRIILQSSMIKQVGQKT